MKKYIIMTSIILGIQIILINVYLIFYGYDIFSNYYNGLFLVGFISVIVGLLVLISDLGAFDLFGYSFYYLGSRYKNKVGPRKYSDYPDYVDKRSERRKKHLPDCFPFFIAGGFFILVSAILLIF